MVRRTSIAALALCLATSFASTGRAQALADRVPGDALFYVGWAGSDAVGVASKDTHLAAVLAESKVHELFGRYLDEAEAKLLAAEPKAREPMQLLRAIAGPTWHAPTALYIAPPATGDDAKPYPRLAILTTAGPEASRLADRLNGIMASGERPPVPIMATAAGDLLCFTVGFDDAAAAITNLKTLSRDEGFVAAVKKTRPDGAIVTYANLEAVAALGERTLAQQDPNSAKKLSAFLDASGLRGAKRYISVSGFDGKDWATQTFVDAPSPRTGLLASAAGPVDPVLLKAVPADATFFASTRLDLAQGIRDLQAALGKSDPEALKNFNMVLGAAHQAAGTSVLSNLLDPLGTDWVVYSSPTVNSTGVLGLVVVNKPDDAVKLKKALVTASINLTNWANIGMSHGQNAGDPAKQMSVHGAMTKIGDADVYYLALPVFAPSWTIVDGRLYLGLYPQSVGAAARSTKRGGPSLVEGEKYKAALARLGVTSPTGTSYNDLPAVVGTGSWYPSFLMLTRYAGFGDLFGLTLPEPLLPPIDTLMANLGPATSATWADDAGFYSKSIVPFPGAPMLSEQGAVGLGGVGGAALGTSILLPSLNRARETANRVASASNLKQIGMGMLLYSNENRNRYPDDFATLLKTQDLSPQVMLSPRAGSGIPADVTTPEARVAYVAEHADYVYLGKGLKNDTPAETIVVYEKPDGLDDGINVLFADGHVEFLFMEPAMAEIAKQKAARGIE